MMNEAEFIVRRILKEAVIWTNKTFDKRLEVGISPLVAAQKKEAQHELINHLIDTFTEGKQNESIN